MALEGTIAWDTRLIQASLFGHEGEGGPSMPSGTPSPTLVPAILHPWRAWGAGQLETAIVNMYHSADLAVPDNGSIQCLHSVWLVSCLTSVNLH